MSVAPEERSRRIAKSPDESKSTENNVAADVHSSGNSSPRDKCQQVSQPIDKPVDEIPANSQHTVGDNGVKTNKVSQGMHLIRVGLTNPDAQRVPVCDSEPMSLDAPSNEPTPLIHASASSISAPGLLSTMPLYIFDPTSLLMDPFDNQYGNQDFGNSTDIDCTLQGPDAPDGLQIQGNMTSDLWFNSIPDFLSTIPSTPTDNESPLLPGPLPNGDTHELYSLGAYSSLLLPLDVVPIHDVNPPPSNPLPGAIDPHTAPLLTSVLTQECPPHAPSISIQLPTDLSLGSLGGGKDTEAVADGRHGANTRGRARKRKADDSLVGMKDSGASNPRKKIANNTGETAEEEATEATTEGKEADRLAKEAKTAQEVAKEAAKAAKVAAKAAKATKEAAKPEQARRSARLHTLLDHLKEAGHTPPMQNLQENTKGT